MAQQPLKICSFKPVCRSCTKVLPNDRPTMCEALNCDDFKVCEGCGYNRTLHEYKGMLRCNPCIANDTGVKSSRDREVKKKVKEEMKEKFQEVMLGQAAKGKAEIKTEDQEEDARIASLMNKMRGAEVDHPMTEPGTPPPGYKDDEKQYYIKRFQEYKEYYRNPSSFYLCHQIILVEVYINYINNRLIGSRNEANFTMLQEQAQASKLLAEYKKLLPDAESEQQSDHDRALGNIYKSYLEESGKRYVGGVSRLLSPGAIALNPVLTFRLDLASIYKRLGFKIEDVSDVLDRVESMEDFQNRTPTEIAEFFGFRIRKEFAIEEEDSKTLQILEEDNDDEDGDGDFE